MVSLPYFDLLFEGRRRGDPLARLFERYVHWGYWEDPAAALGTPEDFAAAMERLDRQVVDAAGVADGQAVLDAGCGFGGTLAGLDARHSGLRLVGVNVDARQLAVARERVRPRPGNAIGFVEADACRLPFPDASFDRVLAVECVFHFPSRLGFLREAARVLRPGGRLALSDFVPLGAACIRKGGGGPLAWLERKVSAGYGTIGGWPDGGYRAMAAAAGLRLELDRDVTRRTLPTYPLLIRLSPELRTATRILQALSVLRLVRYRILAFSRT